MVIKKCKIDCIRDVKEELTEETLLQITEISPHLKLVWESGEVEFNYAKPSGDPYSPKGFYPSTGTWDILGCYEEGFSHKESIIPTNTVEIKTYTNEEFIKLCGTAVSLVALDADTSRVGLCNELFQKSDVTWYTDYSKLISFLEEKKYLSTIKSENWLSIDERKFKINQKAVKIIPLLGDYSQVYYEVDSLGTSLFKEFTNLMEVLYDYIQKDVVTPHTIL